MELKILNTHRGYSDNDVHHLYEYLFWDIELVHDHDLFAELQRNDIWQSTSGFGDSGIKRYSIDFEKSPVIKNFCKEFNSLKDRFFEIVSNDPYFKFRWYKDPEYYANRVSMDTAILKDLPGHVMAPHLDNSHIMMQIILNLIDNTSSTEIYGFDDLSPIHESSQKKNQGLAFFNNPGAVHGINNKTDDRYILYSALAFY